MVFHFNLCPRPPPKWSVRIAPANAVCLTHLPLRIGVMPSITGNIVAQYVGGQRVCGTPSPSITGFRSAARIVQGRYPPTWCLCVTGRMAATTANMPSSRRIGCASALVKRKRNANSKRSNISFAGWRTQPLSVPRVPTVVSRSIFRRRMTVGSAIIAIRRAHL